MSPIALTNPDPLKYSWWLASRAFGITALLFVTASTVLGLVMASGIINRRGLKAKLMPAHEYLALFSVFAIAAHGLVLLGDKWLKVNPIDIFVPGTISYRPLWVAFGIIAGWMTVILALSFYARRQIGVKRWRLMHRAIVLVWILAVVHALGAGTDAGTLWLRIVIMVSIAPALFLTLYRWLPEENRDRDVEVPGTHGDTVIVHAHQDGRVSVPTPRGQASTPGEVAPAPERPVIPAPRRPRGSTASIPAPTRTPKSGR
jgi:sulfoxide reductase heme-binding subunit YedZ